VEATPFSKLARQQSQQFAIDFVCQVGRIETLSADQLDGLRRLVFAGVTRTLKEVENQLMSSKSAAPSL
jgi:hypothetical protein